VNADRLRQVETILFQVIDLPKDQQSTRVAQLCAGDDELTREVTSLLAQVDTASGVLDAPALGTNLADLEPEFTATDDAEDLSGKAIGPYRVERKIASGGMGSVYAALRADGEYTQRVAIKLVKRGMDSEEVLRRFRVEKQALAALSHPNIAHLVDGGVTSDGRPYLVMEYVDGVTLDDYCDERNLGVRERVVLLRHVLEAVRFAHQRLIVHRDLKPRNILVNAEGLPKLLDFGIAKVLSKGETVLFGATTRREEQRLTPDYASPEQLRGERAGTASDVYSLGVILYEILSGRKPYDTQPGMSEAMLLLVREQPPTLPSVAITKSKQEVGAGAARDATQLALARGTTPDRLSRQLRGDLDTIVLMAMHPDPLRRYQSVEALIADVDRYLQGLPIEARKDSAWYRTRKFARRHAFGLSVTALIAAMLMGSLVIVVRERNEAIEAREIAEAVSGFLKRTLESADPASNSRGNPNAKIADVLASGAEDARREFSARPRVLGAVLGSLGRSFMGVGEYDRAEVLLRESLALREKHGTTLEIAEAKFNLAEVLSNKGLNDDAATLALEAWRLYVQANAHPREIAKALNNIAGIDRRRENYDNAERVHREAIAIRRELVRVNDKGTSSALDLADSLNNLAGVLRYRENQSRAVQGADRSPPGTGPVWDEIESLMTESSQLRKAALKSDHSLVLQSQLNLANILFERGRTADAVTLYDSTVQIQVQTYPEHLETARAIRNFGQILQKLPSSGDANANRLRLARSVALLQEARDLYMKKAPANDAQLIQTRRWLAHALKSQAEHTGDTSSRTATAVLAELTEVEAPSTSVPLSTPDRVTLLEDKIWALQILGEAERLKASRDELAALSGQTKPSEPKN
jgi:serine/threonine-protein kinase